MAPSFKLIRIRDYPRDQINIEVDLPLETYRPGDTVNGKIKVNLPDGSPFESAPIFSLNANFETTLRDSTKSSESVELKN